MPDSLATKPPSFDARPHPLRDGRELLEQVPEPVVAEPAIDDRRAQSRVRLEATREGVAFRPVGRIEVLRRGNPNPPPPNATQVLEQLMGSALRGGGQPGGAPGAAPGMAPGGADGAKTISRQQLQAAVSAGEFSSLAEAEEYARVTGYTVR
jgi:hypothetical protein